MASEQTKLDSLGNANFTRTRGFQPPPRNVRAIHASCTCRASSTRRLQRLLFRQWRFVATPRSKLEPSDMDLLGAKAVLPSALARSVCEGACFVSDFQDGLPQISALYQEKKYVLKELRPKGVVIRL